MKNIVEVLQSETKNLPDKLAFIDGKRRITYAELFTAVNKASQELSNLGIKPSKRVAILCEDSIDYVILSLAVIKLTAVAVPVPFGSSREEIGTVLKETKVNFLIFERGAYFSSKAKRLKIDCALHKEFSFLRRPSTGNPPREFFSLNPAFIRFSSGTTGAHKGVIISHEAIIQRTDAADKGLHVTSDDSILWVLSMSFHFVVTILLFLRRGATIILAGRDFPKGLLNAIEGHRATFIYASPLHYQLLASLGAVSEDALRNVRLAVSTAVKLPLDIAEKFYAKFGFELSQAYGIIEVGLAFINTSQDKNKRGCVGRILPDYKLKIIKKDKEGTGEIYLKGKGFFDAYFSPWQRRKEVMHDGWFRTGDLGRLDSAGFLFLISRKKDVINFSGMKIFPEEVESVINQHPAVKESLVYPVEHPSYGQLPHAKIVLKKREGNNFNFDNLRAFCYQRLSRYKVPKEFLCVSRLDKTPSGKLRRSPG
jgi:long-chain acyl-CoA synthetase